MVLSWRSECIYSHLHSAYQIEGEPTDETYGGVTLSIPITIIALSTTQIYCCTRVSLGSRFDMSMRWSTCMVIHLPWHGYPSGLALAWLTFVPCELSTCLGIIVRLSISLSRIGWKWDPCLKYQMHLRCGKICLVGELFLSILTSNHIPSRSLLSELISLLELLTRALCIVWYIRGMLKLNSS